MAKSIQFLRWGGLSPVIQKGFDASMPTMHSPPARRGIYAFPKGRVERFLIGKEVLDPKMHEVISKEEAKRREKNINPLFSPGEEEKCFKTLPSGRIVEYRYATMTAWRTQRLLDEFHKLCDDDSFTVEDANAYREKHQVNVKLKKPRMFTYEGEIWHHLSFKLKPFEIINKKGEWLLTDMDVYHRTLDYELGFLDKKKKRDGYGYTFDHLEVFIERSI